MSMILSNYEMHLYFTFTRQAREIHASFINMSPLEEGQNQLG